MISSLVLYLAVITACSAQQFADQNQLIAVPSDEFLQRLRNWQIALSAPGVLQPEEPAPANKDSRYGLPPPVGPISIPSPPTYQPQPQPPPPPGGYFPPPGIPGGYFPPTPPPKPTIPPIPPTLPPVTRPPPPNNPLSKYCLQPRGQFPSKTCNTYVNCWDDTVIEQECPAGLLFSEKGYCDFPFNVDCSRRPQPPPTEHPPTMPPNHGPCPTPDGTYRDSKNCSIFYVCVYGQPVKFECPPTLVFNTEYGVCDYAYNVPSCPRPHPPIVGTGPVIPPPPPTYPPHPPTYPPHPPTYPPHPPTYPPHPPTYPAHPPTNPPSYYPPPPAYDQYLLKRVPAGLVDEESRCTEGALHPLNSECSQVSLCRNGKTEVINCGHGRAYDNEKDHCVPRHLARC